MVIEMDNSKLFSLVLLELDLSATFDIIDQDILLKLLHKYAGISGTALQWFSSYCQHKFYISGSCSSPKHIPFGVLQGSALGAFSLCTTSFCRAITNRNLNHHLYADDTQVYISLSPKIHTIYVNFK